MRDKKILSLCLAALLMLLMSACGSGVQKAEQTGALHIVQQGMFSAGGTVTAPVPGNYDVTKNWQDPTRAGNTMHVDHANVFYQIPKDDNGNPIVFLHGAGQSRMGWMTAPDGRDS